MSVSDWDGIEYISVLASSEGIWVNSQITLQNE